jgi:hypothetical protein
MVGTVILVATVTAAALVANRSRSARPTALVRLVLPGHRLQAGQVVRVRIVNDASNPVIYTGCFILQLRERDAWTTINSTHRISVPCARRYSAPPQAARSDRKWALMLYDDLRPGRYRITLLYKFLSKHWHAAGLDGHLRQIRATLSILKFDPGPAPQLPERRIKRIALQTAASAGDPHPSLIQYAEGTRFEANRVASQDLVWGWSWAYLIAIRGHFKATGEPGSYAADYSDSPSSQVYSVVAIVLDAKTGHVEDFGMLDRYPKLSNMGAVTTDYRHS